MSLFKCDQCGCRENTALCRYWVRLIDKQPLLCSECDPKILKWHGRFTKRPFDETTDLPHNTCIDGQKSHTHR